MGKIDITAWGIHLGKGAQPHTNHVQLPSKMAAIHSLIYWPHPGGGAFSFVRNILEGLFEYSRTADW